MAFVINRNLAVLFVDGIEHPSKVLEDEYKSTTEVLSIIGTRWNSPNWSWGVAGSITGVQIWNKVVDPYCEPLSYISSPGRESKEIKDRALSFRSDPNKLIFATNMMQGKTPEVVLDFSPKKNHGLLSGSVGILDPTGWPPKSLEDAKELFAMSDDIPVKTHH